MEGLGGSFQDDGLIIPEVGHWSEEKYKLIQYYASLFSASMKRKWDSRIYIDLFSGSGLSKIRGTQKIVAASPLLAMDLKDSFDKYIFCEINNDKLNALKIRINRYFPSLETSFILGDVNSNVNSILTQIPKASRKFKVLAFCLVDPYKLSNLRFQTIQSLSSRYIDFLVLIPTYMDARRSWRNYLKPNNQTVELFLADQNWRAEWREDYQKGATIGKFLISKFSKQMEGLKFLVPKPEDIAVMKIRNKNVLLYHLIFYSRHPLGLRFWQDTVHNAYSQLNLFKTEIL